MVDSNNLSDSIAASKKIEEAKAILRDLGLPVGQQNERSALTLLAFLNLKVDVLWANAANPMLGITPIMDFIAAFYGKSYAPNTRETIRRQTVHQFVEAGLLIVNPDQPSRPINSPKTVYQIEASALELIRCYQTDNWREKLIIYLISVETLKQRYAQERSMQRIPIRVNSAENILLSPGGHNILIKKVINDFCSLFIPEGSLLYVGDTGDKWGYFDKQSLEALGVTVDAHGKMPDVVVHHIHKNWLVLIEAVTSHGPMTPKRSNELKIVFKNSTAGLVFVSAFERRRDLAKYLNEIAWETEVWVAEAPTHIIHFNGERFLGPY